MHNLAQLLQSPTHRPLALQIHQELLSIPSLRSLILDTFSLSLLPGEQTRDTLGSWLVSAMEERRRAGGASLTCWTEATSFGPQDGRLDLLPHLESLVEYLSGSINDPAALHDGIFPASAGMERAALEQEEEGWYRVGGLVGLTWLVEHLPRPNESILQLLAGDLWSVLSPSEGSSGHGQPTVRRAGYLLLNAVLMAYADVSEEYLPVEVLRFCWRETEATVWEIVGPVIVKLLRSESTHARSLNPEVLLCNEKICG